MNQLTKLIELYEELDSPHEVVRKQVKEIYDKLFKEISNDLEKIEEYKACKQYWYDKYMEEKT